MIEKLIHDKQKIELMYSKDTDYDTLIGIITEFDPEHALIKVESKEVKWIFPLSSVKRIRIIE